MDNAQKAIMIGVGLFITIIIISSVLLITNIGTNLINNAQNQLSNISATLQQNLTQTYDGRTMTGNDVIAAVQTYQNSNDVSIRIVVSGSKQFETGKYTVKLTDTESTTYSALKAGGVQCEPVDGTTYTESRKDALANIKSMGGVSETQSYNAFVMKDKDSDTVLGILFVRRGVTDFAGGEIV